MIEKVILVDENDTEIGSEEKLKAHQEKKLHRAFSIFIFNAAGKMLLQKRAKSKYHSGRLWTNTCCGHPRPGETTETAAHRRLKEEMGFDCPLKEISLFTYETDFDNGLFENEIDHVLRGNYEKDPIPDQAEAEGWKWIEVETLKNDISKNPDSYTYWFKVALQKINF